MQSEKKLSWLLAGGVFLTALAIYYTTMAPTVSFWDCGELIAASHVLGNPHPPGNPLLTLLMRAFIVALPFAEIAARANFVSTLTMALTAAMAYLFLVKALRLAAPGMALFARHAGAVVGAFLVAFSDTIWFSAVEAEAYGLAMLIVMAVSWLSLHWFEHRGTPKGDRTLILMTYVGFLGVGVHLFAIVTLPVVALFMLIDRDTRANIPLLASGVAIFSVVYDVGNFLFYAGGAAAICALAAPFAKSPQWRRRWTLAALVSGVALLGFSTYAYVPIRTSVNASLDEAEAGTWPVFKEYIERKQYGSESMIRRAFHRRAQVWNQILVHPHMGYGGYMLAQYFPWKVGDTDSESAEFVERRVFGKTLQFPTLRETIAKNRSVQFWLFVLLQLPFLYGGWLAFRRSRAVGGYLLALYLVTSFGLIFYLNFADGSQMELRDYEYWKSLGFDPNQKPPPVHMEVRERDYFFTPGFIYMGILFGVAAAFLLNWLAARSRFLVRPLGLGMVALAFAVPVWSNYKEHDRTGDYVPYDYAYNLLMSCRPNSILFTNGDNDTFPLWFLQEVEGIRKDVRVVNLSLVNTTWYMHQLRDHEPALNITFSRARIDAMQPQAWPFKGPAPISIPGTKISYMLNPLPYLRVQDIMVLHIVQNNFPKRPVHFAVTIGGDNAMGLDQYTIMEGMVYTLVEEPKARAIDVAATARLVDSVYRFRGLGDPDVFIDNNTAGLLTNYSATNFRLAGWAQDSLQRIAPRLEAATGAEKERLQAEKASLVAFAKRYLDLNARILPDEWRVHYYAGQLYTMAGETAKADSAFARGMNVSGPNARIFAMNLAQSYMRQNRIGDAEKVLEEMIGRFPDDLEIAFALSEMLQQAGDLPGARDALAEWLARNPRHEYAQAVGQRVQEMGAILQGAPAAPAP